MTDVPKDTLKQVFKFFEKAIGYNRPDFHIFVEFAGHVNLVTARVYVGGWHEDKEPYEIGTCYIDHPKAEWKLGQMLELIQYLSLEVK